jgi:integrase
MAKRANNEGSLHRLPSGNWRAQISLNSKRLSFSAKTKRECQIWLKKMISQVDEGLTLQGTHQTLKEYLATWLIGIQNSIRPRTYVQYEMTCRLHILPTLGEMKLFEIRPEVIQKLYASQLKSGVGARTVDFIHSILHMAFEQAVKLEILIRNPVNATTPPKIETKEMHFYDEGQVNEFLLAAKGNRNEAIYHLALSTGLRQSELLGLQWPDLDWQKKSLNVQRQLKRNGKKGDLFAQPKTKNGRRTLILGEATLAILKCQQTLQNEERIAAGERWQENNLIFCTPIGTPKNQSNLYREFKTLLQVSGLPEIRFHDLRHSSASLLLNHGIPAIVVSRRLGHYKVSMTLDIYGHLIPEMQNEAADLIDELITPIPVELHTVAHDPEKVSKKA